MKRRLKRLFDDTRGAALIETTITIPVFILMIFGVIQAGLLLWAQIGLQHGVDLAARCASVSDAAIIVGQNVTTTPTSCYNKIGSATANASTVKAYAATQSFGLSPDASIFTVSTLAAPVSCNMVSASYPFNLLGGSTVPGFMYIFSLTLTAQSCHPIPS